MLFRVFLLHLTFLAGFQTSSAQVEQYAPFTLNAEAVTASLKIKGELFTDKYAGVFQKHGLNANATMDWDGLLEEIARVKESDLYSSGDVSFEAGEDGVELTGRHIDDLEQMLKSLRLVITTPEKVDAFLKANGPLPVKAKSK